LLPAEGAKNRFERRAIFLFVMELGIEYVARSAQARGYERL
jgi:hypothetical protein